MTERAILRERTALFSDYMSMTRFRYAYEGEERTSDILSGPGHDVSIVAAFAFSRTGELCAVLKGGDTRPARTLRREPYVKIGTIGGRMDHHDLDATEIAASEIGEEVGAEVVEGSLTELGAVASPTMPDESTEADRYFLAFVRPGAGPMGDGGGLELPGLLHPLSLSLDDAFRAMGDGRIGEGARARTAYARGLSKIGFSRTLGGFGDEAWDTLGLGARVDAAAFRSEQPWVDGKATVDLGGVSIHMTTQIPVEGGVMIDARASHLGVDGNRVGRRFKMQFLSVPQDRAKVAIFARDESGRPFVHVEPRLRAGMLVKRDLLAEPYAREVRPVGLDLIDVRVQPDRAEEEIRHVLGPPILLGVCDASPGQSDLRYHLFAVEKKDPKNLVPLRDALRAMRLGEGDATAEALLVALADHLRYVPELDRVLRPSTKAAPYAAIRP